MQTRKTWNKGSTGEDLGKVDVKISLILRKANASYEGGKKEYKLNHLLFMDDLKLLSKSEEQMDTLVKAAHVFSANFWMEFGMKKCGILTMKRGKVVRC